MRVTGVDEHDERRKIRPLRVPALPPILVSFEGLGQCGIGYSRKHLIDMVKRNEFPRPVRLSKNRIAWRWPDIQEWASTREPLREISELDLVEGAE
jgi:prophage regulatory protein